MKKKVEKDDDARHLVPNERPESGGVQSPMPSVGDDIRERDGEVLRPMSGGVGGMSVGQG